MKNKNVIAKILRYIGKYKLLAGVSLLIATASVALTLWVPVLIGEAIDFIVETGNVDFDNVWKKLVLVLISIGITALLQWLMNTINNRITFNVVKDIREEAFEKLEILDLKYIDSHPHGETVNRVITDVDQFADGLLLGFSQLFTGVLMIIGTLAFMLTINAAITAIVVVLTPLSLFVARFISKNTYSMFKLQSETRGEETALIDEAIGNIKVVKAFSHEDKMQEKFDEVNGRLEKCSLKAIFFSSLTNPSTRFVNGLVYAAVALTGAFAAINGSITVGALSCFLSYANQYTKPFNEISGVITELQNAFACAGKIFELLDEKPQIPDRDGAVVLQNVTGNVKIDNVSFAYDKEKPLITSFNLDVEPGQKIAIVGPTGCGKTTFINLLMRFYDVDGGSISVDGNDIRDVKRKSLRRSYGMILQETWMKSGTVKENIAMGRPDATPDEIIEAAKAANAHGFIKRLPDGYDTVITENGSNLSEGQKQLICIARVMLCRPSMLILDEATSSIDTRTEIKVQNAFDKLMNGKTSFVVAHRLSTIREADVILVMRNGNIVEKGTHDELLARQGFYAELYNSQFAH